MFCQLNLTSEKGPNSKIGKKCKKNYQRLKSFPRSFRSLGIFYKIHISGVANRHASVQYAKYIFFLFFFLFFFFFFFFFFLSSHHNTNPLLHLYHFRLKNIIIDWPILTVNHQGSYSPSFFFSHWIKHFCKPANFVTFEEQC